MYLICVHTERKLTRKESQIRFKNTQVRIASPLSEQ